MKRYDILLGGRSFSVIPLSDAPDEGMKQSPTEMPIFIYPVESADMKVELGRGADGVSTAEIMAVLSFFFSVVRGYPETELTVEIDGNVSRLEILDTPPGYALLKLEKCKRLYTKYRVLPDGTEHSLYSITLGPTVRVMLCEELACFDASVLDGLRIVKGLPDARYAIAASLTDCIEVLVGVDAPPGYFAAAAASLCYGDTERRVYAEGIGYTVRQSADGTTCVYVPCVLTETLEI